MDGLTIASEQTLKQKYRLIKPPPRAGRLIPYDEALTWINTSQKWDQLTYHQGFLAFDRFQDHPVADYKREIPNPVVDDVATLMWSAATQDIVALVQKRVEPWVYEYRAVRTANTNKKFKLTPRKLTYFTVEK